MTQKIDNIDIQPIIDALKNSVPPHRWGSHLKKLDLFLSVVEEHNLTELETKKLSSKVLQAAQTDKAAEKDTLSDYINVLKEAGLRIYKNKKSIELEKLLKQKITNRMEVKFTNFDNIERILEVLNTKEKLFEENSIWATNIEQLRKLVKEEQQNILFGGFTIKTVNIGVVGDIQIQDFATRKEIYSFWEEIEEKNNIVEKLETLEAAYNRWKKYPINKGKIERVGPLFEKVIGFKNKPLSYIGEYVGTSVANDSKETIFLKLVTDYEMALNISERNADIKEEQGERNTDYMTSHQELLREAAKHGDTYGSMIPSKLQENTNEDAGQHYDEYRAPDFLVDPLLAHYMNQGGNLGNINTKMHDELKEIIDSWDGEQEPIFLEVNAALKRKIHDLGDTRSVDPPYHLPYYFNVDRDTSEEKANSSFSMTDTYDTVDAKELVRSNRDIIDFFDAVEKLVMKESHLFPTKSHIAGLKTKPSKQDAKDDVSQSARVSVGQEGKRGKPRTFSKKPTTKMETAVKELLESVYLYYFEPHHTAMKAIIYPAFMSHPLHRTIQVEAPRFSLSFVGTQAYTEMINTKKIPSAGIWNDIYYFLHECITVGPKEINNSFVQRGRAAAFALTKIFGKAYKEKNRNHMGAIIHDLIVRMLYDDSKEAHLLNISLYGVSITERNKRFESQNKTEFPLFVLPAFIEENKGLLQNNQTKDVLTKLRKLFRGFKWQSVVLSKLLLAHDSIRKMKGEDIIMGHRPITIEHTEEVINKIYDEFNIDLAHLEIEQIVNEVDSFNNIAKSYGINSEIVYQIKAQFR